MILRMPSYCSGFRCTADRCTDNCCIGWEIDIDSSTLDYYRSVDGEFGIRLRDSITGDSPACFRLKDNDRCPFLNCSNLCDIFIQLGEEHLCQICTDHPRYFEWFDGVKEGGTGLGCEESARLIITQDQAFSVTETEIPYEDCEEYDRKLYRCMYDARDRIISYLQKRELSISERISDVLSYAEELQYRADNGDFDSFDILRDEKNIHENDIPGLLRFFASLEPLSPERPEYLRDCASVYDRVMAEEKAFSNYCPDMDRYLENLSVYFIWRHFMKGVFSGEFYSSVYLMSVSIAVIRYLCQCSFVLNGTITENDIITISKEYSKETEYSDSNLSAVLDSAYS